jgi:hypothetical protein
MITFLLGALLLVPALCWAQVQSPNVFYFPDHAMIQLDVTGLSTAVGTVTQKVKFVNPRGTVWDRQILLIDIYSEAEQQVEWDGIFKTGYGLALPTKTTAGLWVRWGFAYDARQRVWNFLANTQGPKIPAPAEAVETTPSRRR